MDPTQVRMGNLVDRLNSIPMWAELDQNELATTDAAISDLVELFRSASQPERLATSGHLSRSAKWVMFGYARRQAEEARRSGSREAIVNGLVSVILGRGSSGSATAGFLLAILLRSCEAAGMDAYAVFEEASQSAVDDLQRADFMRFLSLPPAMRGLSRFGAIERTSGGEVRYYLPFEEGRPVSWFTRILGRRLLMIKAQLHRQHKDTGCWLP